MMSHNLLRKAITAATLSCGLLFVAAASRPAMAAPQYDYDYGHVRGLVDRTQSDLRAASDLEPQGEKQHVRYRDAQKDLSDFDRHLSKGHFDKDKLNHCIDRIKDILDHNTLQASSRDALMHDIEDLRMARDHYSR
jgi:hypothetical protein